MQYNEEKTKKKCSRDVNIICIDFVMLYVYPLVRTIFSVFKIKTKKVLTTIEISFIIM